MNINTNMKTIFLGIYFLLFGFISDGQCLDWAQQECLALNIYHEARNQPVTGQIAVAHVTLNRVASSLYPDTICKVVWEKRRSRKTKRMVPQFSWTLDGKSDTPMELEAWGKALNIASSVMAEKMGDLTFGSMYYHADYVNPYWTKSFKKTVLIGTHIFYKRT